VLFDVPFGEEPWGNLVSTVKTMKKNIIIAALILLNLIVFFICLRPRVTKETESGLVSGFPEVKLAKNERITFAKIQFRNAGIKAIRNIPPGWMFSMEFDPPPHPTVFGSIRVGVAAVGSSKKLPIFELEPYVHEGPTPRAVQATFDIEEYSPNAKEPRRVTVDLE
jgi:hypothetical protein